MFLCRRGLHFPDGSDLVEGHFDHSLANQEPQEIPRSDPEHTHLFGFNRN